MKYAFFSINAFGGDAGHELNAFCSSRRILGVDKHFVQNGPDSYWAFCISYMDQSAPSVQGKSKIDYKDVLSEQDFTIYAELRTLRKAIAESNGVPAYAVFTNDQLATMVRDRITTRSDMAKIPGVGEAKVNKYADAFIQLLVKAMNEAKAGEDTNDANEANANRR